MTLAREYPYGLKYDRIPEGNALRETARQIYEMTQCELPLIRGDWFVSVATRSPIYDVFLGLPPTSQELEARLGINVAENIRNGKAKRSAFTKSGVSKNANRMVERHRTLFGAYYKSYDFLPNSARGNLLQFPLGPDGADNRFSDLQFHHDGGEIIFHLPNGLQGYMLANASGKKIDAGPAELVSDDKLRVSGSPLIVTGVSCIACHQHGVIRGFHDEVREGSRAQGDAADFVKRLYPPDNVFNKFLDADEVRFLTALEKAISPFVRTSKESDKSIKAFGEPVAPVAANYANKSLDIVDLAAELGVPDVDRLQQRMTERAFRDLGLSPLAKPGGVVKRDYWQSSHDGHSVFQQTARLLDLGVPKVYGKPKP